MMNIKDYDLNELKEITVSLKEPSYRAVQLFEGLYKGAPDFMSVKNIPKTLLNSLLEKGFHEGTLEVLRDQYSEKDGTHKILFRLKDAETIETVVMKYKYGLSVCVSSQVGCLMGCTFCASAIGGKVRNLSPGEMADQVISSERITGERIGHMVVMGMGEPFDNYENLSKFLRLLHEEKGKNMSYRNMTVSTAGIVPMIKRFGEDFPQVNLAISLHSAKDEVRTMLMPINKRYPVGEVINAAKDYSEKTKRRITFEYALIKGVNDSQKDMEELSRLLKGMLCHVNLIPLNPVKESGYKGTERSEAENFALFLKGFGVEATVRRQLGKEIDGACGQLRVAEKGSLSV